LFASRLVRIRARIGAIADFLGGSATPMSSPLGALGDPGSDDAYGEDLEGGGDGLIRRLLARPGIRLVLALSAVTLLAERALLFASGPLKGGALLPVPRGASDLWSSYAAAWHDVVVGTAAASPPGVAALAALSTVTWGRPSLAVALLILACVPLSGLTAYLAAARLVRHLYLRLWAAATWALLPVATGTVAAGRVNAAAVHIALPLLALWAGRLLTSAGGWWRAWALGLALGVTSAFAPLLWPLSALVLLAGAAVNLTLEGGRRRAAAAVLVAVTPAAILFPWSLHALTHPSAFVAGPQVAAASLPTWQLALLSPGGPGLPWVLATLGLVLAGVLGTVRQSFRGLALASWGVALVSLFAAALLSRLEVDGQPIWPGVAVQLAAIAILIAALVAANGARTQLAGTSFGPRQLLAALVAVAAILTPAFCALAWVLAGASGPLQRDDNQLLPAFARAELQASPGLRVLILAPRPDGRLAYDLTTGDGARLETARLAPDGAQRRALDAVVADLASPRGSDAAEALSTRAVRYVGVRSGASAGPLSAVLDSQAGLVRRFSGRLSLWQVAAPTNRLTLLPPVLAAKAVAGGRAPTPDVLRQAPPTALSAGPEQVRTRVPSGVTGRLLVLADAADGRWSATLDGAPLEPRTAWGWAQGFTMPAKGGILQVHYRQTTRRVGLGTQGALLLLVAVLSAPGGRRARGLEQDITDDLDRESARAARDSRVPLAAL